jgi:hypothetical protein
MTRNEGRQGFWRELMQAFCVLHRVQWQAPWKEQQGC